MPSGAKTLRLVRPHGGIEGYSFLLPLAVRTVRRREDPDSPVIPIADDDVARNARLLEWIYKSALCFEEADPLEHRTARDDTECCRPSRRRNPGRSFGPNVLNPTD